MYGTVDMDGLHDMIDALGGVNVTSNDTFTTKGTKFVKGQSTHVDGDTAMAFIRSRKGRCWRRFWPSERQQLILQAMANKMTSTSALTHFSSLINRSRKMLKPI